MSGSRRKPLVVAALTVALMVLGVGVGWAAYLNQQLDDVRRIEVDFGPDGAAGSSAGVPPDAGGAGGGAGADKGTNGAGGQRGGTEETPDGAGPVTILVAGVDAGDGPAIADDLADGQWTPGRSRSDTVMVVHLPADRRSAQVVSIPRDAFVRVPGHGFQKINAAFSLGGPSLYVKTVERLTGVDMDHLMIVDWKAFKRITRAVGGVQVRIPQDVYDASQDVHWKAGVHRLEGQRALQYVRQRHGLPRGDFDRIARQQNFIRATMEKVLAKGTLLNPVKLTEITQTVGEHLLVDDQLSSSGLRDLALSMRNLSADSVRFLTIPTTSLDTVRGESVVRVDRPETRRLLRAVVHERLGRYLRRNDADVLDGAGRVR